LHLQTRFAQLETAGVLHLYTEGFRTVEDIYNILQISHQRRKQNPELPAPKPKLMAKYYEQLTTLFWVSENHLFHAFAWFKYYALCKEFNKGMSENIMAKQASAVLLAALCIPSLPTKTGDSSISAGGSASDNRFDDSVMQEKMARMATLLGFHTRNPTREALLEEISARGIFEQVPDFLQKLFYLLEQDSDPLVLVETAKPLLDQLSTEAASSDDSDVTSLSCYVQPLRSVLLLKLLWNLSAAYHTVKIDFLRDLTDGLGMSFEDVEKEIVLFTQKHKGLVVRMDHRSGCLRFGDAQLESDSMRSQLTVLAQQLDKVCQTLAPAEANVTELAQLYQSIRENRVSNHTKMLERKAWIEQRKEEMERLAQEKVRLEQEKATKEEAARKAEEEQRIKREQRLREQEKQNKIHLEMENLKKQQLLQAMGHNTESLTQEEMAKLDTEKLAKEHQDKVNKKKEEAERKTREEAKRLDYLVRAIRIEELPLIKGKYEEKAKKDREQYDQENVEKSQRAKVQWESDKQDKERLSAHSVFDYMDQFQIKVMEGRQLKHEVLCEEAETEAEIQAEKAKLQRARKRKQDEANRKAEEEAKLKREEEERKAEEERQKKEEARREREAKEEESRKAEAVRMAQERERQGRAQEGRGLRSSRELESASGGGNRYMPPGRRGGQGGGDSSNRYGNRERGYPGGGRYEGRRGGGDNDDRRGGYGGDRRGGGGGSSYNDRDGDRRGGSTYSDRDRDRRGGGGGSSYNDRDGDRPGSRWRR
jgi:translation initiation factor 3 subunit A